MIGKFVGVFKLIGFTPSVAWCDSSAVLLLQ